MFRGEYAYPTLLSEKIDGVPEDNVSVLKIIDGYVHFINTVADDEVIIISRPKNDYMQYLVSFLLMALLCYIAVSMLSITHPHDPIFEKNYYTSRINALLFLSLTAMMIRVAVKDTNSRALIREV